MYIYDWFVQFKSSNLPRQQTPPVFQWTILIIEPRGSTYPCYTQNNALCEKPLTKWHLEFASPSGDYSTLLCLSLSFLIFIPLIPQNTFWSYKILISFSTIF